MVSSVVILKYQILYWIYFLHNINYGKTEMQLNESQGLFFSIERLVQTHKFDLTAWNDRLWWWTCMNWWRTELLETENKSSIELIKVYG